MDCENEGGEMTYQEDLIIKNSGNIAGLESKVQRLEVKIDAMEKVLFLLNYIVTTDLEVKERVSEAVEGTKENLSNGYCPDRDWMKIKVKSKMPNLDEWKRMFPNPENRGETD